MAMAHYNFNVQTCSEAWPTLKPFEYKGKFGRIAFIKSYYYYCHIFADVIQ